MVRAGKKINFQSTTELELVGICEYIRYNICVFFFAALGYDMKKKIVYQDNQSTIQMLENGSNLCTGHSRNIKVSFL